MKARWLKASVQGFTLVELLVTMAIIGLLAALLLPALSKGKVQAQRVKCAAQLKDLGVAYHSFAHDHQSLFPMEVPVSEGGAFEFAAQEYLAGADFSLSERQFQPLAGELSTPRTLVCPADIRTSAASFGVLRTANLSYLVGLDAEYNTPASILLVDRNLTNATRPALVAPVGGSMQKSGWTHELHQTRGNVLFADGHVEARALIEFKHQPRQIAGAASGWMMGAFTLPRLPSYPAGGSGGFSPSHSRAMSATQVPWRPVLQTESRGLFSMLQQPPQFIPSPLAQPQSWMAAGAVPALARTQRASVAPVAPVQPGPETKPAAVAAALPPPATVAAASSSINYWLLVLLLLLALVLRYLLLRSVSKKGTRHVGQAIPQGRWSRRAGRN